MQLNVFERLLIRNIVLEEVQELISGLFTGEELIDLQIKQDGKQVKWKVKRDDGTDIQQERDIAVSDVLKAKIGTFLRQLKDTGGLGPQCTELYNKFVGGEVEKS